MNDKTAFSILRGLFSTSQTFWVFQNVLKFNSKRLYILGESGQEKNVRFQHGFKPIWQGSEVTWCLHFLFLLVRVPLSLFSVPQLPPYWRSSSTPNPLDMSAFSSHPSEIVPPSLLRMDHSHSRTQPLSIVGLLIPLCFLNLCRVDVLSVSVLHLSLSFCTVNIQIMVPTRC